MITEIQLRNWKSFERATVLIDQITFLIGTNASGKSNVVDALLFLSRLGSGDRLSEVCKSIRGGLDRIVRNGCESATISVRFKRGKAEYKYTLSISTDDKDAYVDNERLSVLMRDNSWKELFYTDEIAASQSMSQITARFQKDRPGPRKGIKLRRDITVLTQIQGLNVLKEIKEGAIAALETFSSIFVLDPNPGRMRGFPALSETLEADGSNVAGVIAALPQEEQSKVEAEIVNYVKGLPEKDLRRVWAERVGRFNDAAMLYCEEAWDEDNTLETDARSMSDGTLRFIAIIVALLTMAKDSLLVVEEIDNGLHPSRAGELVGALRGIAAEREFDVVCTTHNPVLIDALGKEILESVSCVSREGRHGSSSVSRISDRPEFIRDLAVYSPGQMMIKNKI